MEIFAVRFDYDFLTFQPRNKALLSMVWLQLCKVNWLVTLKSTKIWFANGAPDCLISAIITKFTIIVYIVTVIEDLMWHRKTFILSLTANYPSNRVGRFIFYFRWPLITLSRNNRGAIFSLQLVCVCLSVCLSVREQIQT